MKTMTAVLLALTALLGLRNNTAAADDAVYELRVYTCEPGKLAALHERFRSHTMDLFARHGMENVAYWVPTDKAEHGETLIYLLKHKSREAAKASWEAFRQDPQWQAVAKASREAHGKILSKAPESTYLGVTDYSAEPGPVSRDKRYELRTYTAAEGKLESLHARFRDHTDKLFARHGMKSYAYWSPLDGPKSKNVLIYILEHTDEESASLGWTAFGADPDWRSARQASEENGRLLVQGGVERVYMEPAEYSPSK